MKNIHDALVKKAMSEIALAKDYFSRVLPQPLKDVIDLETLSLTQDSFIDSKLVTHYADLVFKCSGYQGNEYNICFIFEHKSSIKKDLALQLLQYITGILSKGKKTIGKPEIPIAIVFNHGHYKGAKPTISKYLGTEGGVLDRYIPSFDYILDDITQLSDEEIYSINNGFLVSLLLTLKHFKDEQWIRKNPYYVFNRIDIDNRNLIQEFFVYYLSLAPFEVEETLEIVKTIDQQKNTNYMGVIDILIEKGKEEGREEGKLEGIDKGISIGSYKTQVESVKKMYAQNCDIAFIQSIVSLSKEEIKIIISEIENEFKL